MRESPPRRSIKEWLSLEVIVANSASPSIGRVIVDKFSRRFVSLRQTMVGQNMPVGALVLLNDVGAGGKMLLQAPPAASSPERLGVVSGRYRRTILSADDDFHAAIQLPATGIRVARNPIRLTVAAAHDS